MKGRVIIFSITGCPFCMRAKDKMQKLGIEYMDINLDNYPERRTEAKERSGKNTVPQIFFNNRHIGGFDDFDKLAESELQELIREVEENPAPADAPQPPSPKSADSAKAGEEIDFTCELDEYAQLVNDFKGSGLIKDRRKGFIHNYKNSFVGKEAVDWLVSSKKVEREKAVEMCRQLVERNFGHSLEKGKAAEFKDDDTIYRLLEDDESTALNSGMSSSCEPRPAPQVAEELRRLILNLYSEFLSKDGKGVDYAAMGQSKEFIAYIKHTAELQRVKLEGMTREETLAFFVNIYNALVIHANVIRGPPVNLWQRYKFFNTICYTIGGYTFALNEIENGVLRSNRKAIGAVTKPFSKSDPRLKVSLPAPEPKIHFALVCGAKSCPPIKTYTSAGIDEELSLAAEAFLEGEDGCVLNMPKREIRLSKIFQWYKEDFGSNNEELVQFVLAHMGKGQKKDQLEELLVSGNFKVGFMKYNWI
ncbi:hypothetical protein OS493_009684 [Desmophyllum pertusum]|uniref:DEP domain-containing protein n=1 Tax=Desmophyllum pertusum TaxID=174260 RepID=A0A9W9YU68_9CNID|nr:hypothetical protein OS493_009684 [Desmophyllum pertusum]